VADAAADLALAEEALEEARRGHEVAVDDLQGDAIADVEARRVLDDLGQVDGAHAAGAEFAEGEVGTEPDVDHAGSPSRGSRSILTGGAVEERSSPSSGQ